MLRAGASVGGHARRIVLRRDHRRDPHAHRCRPYRAGGNARRALAANLLVHPRVRRLRCGSKSSSWGQASPASLSSAPAPTRHRPPKSPAMKLPNDANARGQARRQLHALGAVARAGSMPSPPRREALVLVPGGGPFADAVRAAQPVDRLRRSRGAPHGAAGHEPVRHGARASRRAWCRPMTFPPSAPLSLPIACRCGAHGRCCAGCPISRNRGMSPRIRWRCGWPRGWAPHAWCWSSIAPCPRSRSLAWWMPPLPRFRAGFRRRGRTGRSRRHGHLAAAHSGTVAA